MEPKLAVVTLWAEDIPKTAHFYRDVLELKLIAHHGGHPHFNLEGVYLALRKGKPAFTQDTGHERFPLIALAVEDLEASIERLRLHQVELPWGIEGDAQSRWVMFYDPAGNLIEVVEFKSQSP